MTTTAVAALLAATSVHAQQGPFLYVPGGGANNVPVIDTSNNTVTGTIANTPTGTFAVAVSGDESFAYVTGLSASGVVSRIDTATNTVVATIPFGTNTGGVVLTPNGRFAYATNDVGGGNGSVGVIDSATNTLLTTIPVANFPTGVTVSPDGSTVYVASRSSTGGFGNVTAINTATNTAVLIPITGQPTGGGITAPQPISVVVSPDGKTLYVGNQFNNSITAVNTANPTMQTVIPLPTGPSINGLAITSNGQTLYVAIAQAGVIPINTATNTVGPAINVGAGANGLAVSPDGTTVYVTVAGTGQVVPINTATNLAGTPITLAPGLEIFPGICSNGNALLASGSTFVARTSGALACTLASGPTGSPGPIFTGGTLQFAGPNIISALPIILQAAGGTFDTNGNNATLSGVISGPGALAKIGAGALTLTGTDTYTGATTVNAGALIVEGSIASSVLTTVNSGAALIGGGTVGSTVINSGGFLAPGPLGAIGTLTVAGNLAFQSGAYYIVQVSPTTASNTNVSGTATLAGTLAAVFTPGLYQAELPHSDRRRRARGQVRLLRDPRLAAGLPGEGDLRRQYRIPAAPRPPRSRTSGTAAGAAADGANGAAAGHSAGAGAAAIRATGSAGSASCSTAT